MKKPDEHLKNITGKDETKALESVKYLINNKDVELFKSLVKKSDFLFDFVKENINKRFSKSVNQENYKNLLSFFDVYSQDYDDLFISLLANYADEDLTDEMLKLLENGSEAQKSYAAKYFYYIPDTVSSEILLNYVFSESESLSFNSAQALGKMKDEISYSMAIKLLENEDDFDKLKAVKFFTAYGYNAPVEKIFEAMKTSSMPENIAGEIPYIISLITLFDTDNKKNVLITVDNIITGLGEILPLSQIFQFELYEIINLLIETNKSDNYYHSIIAKILLKSLLKMQILCNNEEYIFDEDKNTKQELSDILNILESQSFDFWQMQKSSVIKELTHCRYRVLGALEVIKDFKLIEAIPEIYKLLDSAADVVICESIASLKVFDALDRIDKNLILAKISDENIKAIIESYWR